MTCPSLRADQGSVKIQECHLESFPNLAFIESVLTHPDMQLGTLKGARLVIPESKEERAKGKFGIQGDQFLIGMDYEGHITIKDLTSGEAQNLGTEMFRPGACRLAKELGAAPVFPDGGTCENFTKLDQWSQFSLDELVGLYFTHEFLRFGGVFGGPLSAYNHSWESLKLFVAGEKASRFYFLNPLNWPKMIQALPHVVESFLVGNQTHVTFQSSELLSQPVKSFKIFSKAKPSASIASAETELRVLKIEGRNPLKWFRKIGLQLNGQNIAGRQIIVEAGERYLVLTHAEARSLQSTGQLVMKVQYEGVVSFIQHRPAITGRGGLSHFTLRAYDELLGKDWQKSPALYYSGMVGALFTPELMFRAASRYASPLLIFLTSRYSWLGSLAQGGKGFFKAANIVGWVMLATELGVWLFNSDYDSALNGRVYKTYHQELDPVTSGVDSVLHFLMPGFREYAVAHHHRPTLRALYREGDFYQVDRINDSIGHLLLTSLLDAYDPTEAQAFEKADLSAYFKEVEWSDQEEELLKALEALQKKQPDLEVIRRELGAPETYGLSQINYPIEFEPIVNQNPWIKEELSNQLNEKQGKALLDLMLVLLDQYEGRISLEEAKLKYPQLRESYLTLREEQNQERDFEKKVEDLYEARLVEYQNQITHDLPQILQDLDLTDEDLNRVQNKILLQSLQKQGKFLREVPFQKADWADAYFHEDGTLDKANFVHFLNLKSGSFQFDVKRDPAYQIAEMRAQSLASHLLLELPEFKGAKTLDLARKIGMIDEHGFYLRAHEIKLVIRELSSQLKRSALMGDAENHEQLRLALLRVQNKVRQDLARPEMTDEQRTLYREIFE